MFIELTLIDPPKEAKESVLIAYDQIEGILERKGGGSMIGMRGHSMNVTVYEARYKVLEKIENAKTESYKYFSQEE